MTQRNRPGISAAAVTAFVLLRLLGVGPVTASDKPLVVVGTSMLECAVKDVAGDRVLTHRLAPPGGCPGHFDMRPKDFEAAATCAALVRHDYQAFLDEKLRPTAGAPRRTIVVASDVPLTIPEGYLAACRQVYEGLRAVAPEHAGELKLNLELTEARVKASAAEALRLAAPLKGKVVVASEFQRRFCEWLGLTVAGVFDRADEMSLRDVERLVASALEQKAAAVVANLQRGDREAKPIAERLRLPIITLTNFPLTDQAQPDYSAMLWDNTQRLVKSLQRAP